jgi:hypothetical protein
LHGGVISLGDFRECVRDASIVNRNIEATVRVKSARE